MKERTRLGIDFSKLYRTTTIEIGDTMVTIRPLTYVQWAELLSKADLVVAKCKEADITLENIKKDGEPTADIVVKYSELHGNQNGIFEIGGKDIPTLIDEIPVIAVVAATGDFETIIKDAGELKVKESNRIDSVVENLKAMGCDIEATDDGMVIHGGKPLQGADINSYNDHRLAMSFAIASLAANGTTRILDESCVNISYPTFFNDLQSLI